MFSPILQMEIWSIALQRQGQKWQWAVPFPQLVSKWGCAAKRAQSGHTESQASPHQWPVTAGSGQRATLAFETSMIMIVMTMPLIDLLFCVKPNIKSSVKLNILRIFFCKRRNWDYNHALSQSRDSSSLTDPEPYDANTKINNLLPTQYHCFYICEVPILHTYIC